MNSSKLITQAEQILKQRNLVIIFCVLLLISNIFLSILVLTKDRSIVLVPNFLNQESTINNNKASRQYIEALTRDVVNLMLNITPENTLYIEKNILAITHPKYYGILKSALVARSKDVINRKISTYFAAKSMTIRENGVYVIGSLSTFIGKKEVSSEEKTYFIEYNFSGFQPLIMGFEEILANEKE